MAGGVGGAKLAHGLAQLLTPEQLTIIVNTGDDFEHLGLLICPDIDTVLYNLAEVNHPQQGWGRAEETFHVLEEARRLGHDAWFLLGDKDIALHLLRREMVDAGLALSEITTELARRLGVRHPVLPMSDDPVRTIIHTPEGDLPFQEYFVHRRCEPVMRGMTLAGLERAHLTPAARAALEEAHLIIICPSNPYVSIDPILALPDVRNLIASKPTVAVSPIIGGRALKGPAAKMMAELGADVSALGVARHYWGLVNGFVLDVADASLVEAVHGLGMKTLVTNAIMSDNRERARLAREILDWVKSI
ncbi:MAG: 2-phospho-L-lactate transferase [Chloroflexi bacterium]|nr:2-phospho-L-lactate transferase [Chloroflexota bacterium]